MTRACKVIHTRETCEETFCKEYKLDVKHEVAPPLPPPPAFPVKISNRNIETLQ